MTSAQKQRGAGGASTCKAVVGFDDFDVKSRISARETSSSFEGEA